MKARRLIRRIEMKNPAKNVWRMLEKPFINASIFGIYWERDVLRQRIAERLAKELMRNDR